jgi:CMP-N,N'-diacetyllegionaminic acid synthase
MEILYLITARGGSKGLPGKNIKPLNGIPLLWYSIDFARNFSCDDNICLSTDCDEIIAIANKRGLSVPFKRPKNLSTDSSSTYEVILHALDYYKAKGKLYDAVVLLQPTSPFRKNEFLKRMFQIYTPDLDMVVTVKECHENPYYSLFEEDKNGILIKSKSGTFTRRQDVPKVFSFNGSIYLINVKSLYKSEIFNFTRVKKYVLDDFYSLDIDSPFDWIIAENLVASEYLNI